MNIVRYYCSYLDHRYLPRGIALFRSLRKHNPDCQLFLLCLDDICYDAVLRLALPGLHAISLPELEAFDPDFASVRPRRTVIEYYFTSTPILPLYIMEENPDIDIVTYLDSDLFFFSDPEAVFDEMGGASVVIIPHRFTEAGRFRERYGVYNVGWVSWRNDLAGRACLSWYRERCLEWCHDVEEDNRFADQKYLDSWPAQFAGVHVLQHKGCNLAPWNVENYGFTSGDGTVRVDDVPVVFFHFHDLKSWYQLDSSATGLADYVLNISDGNLRYLHDDIYRPYIAALRDARDEIDAVGLSSSGASEPLRHLRRAPSAATLPAWRDAWDWSLVPAEAAEGFWPSFPCGAPIAATAIGPADGADRPVALDASGMRVLIARVATAHAAASRVPELDVLVWGPPVLRAAFRRSRPGIAGAEASAAASPEAAGGRAARWTEYPLQRIAEAFLTKPAIIVAGGCVSETKDWPAALARLTAANPSVLLVEVGTVVMRPTFAASRRRSGRAAQEPIWIHNRDAFVAAVKAMGWNLGGEWIWPEPIHVEGVVEPVTWRTFLLQPVASEPMRAPV